MQAVIILFDFFDLSDRQPVRKKTASARTHDFLADGHTPLVLLLRARSPLVPFLLGVCACAALFFVPDLTLLDAWQSLRGTANLR